MTWDPEIDDPVRPRRIHDEPSDFGADLGRDLGDEPPPAYRTEAPRVGPVDPQAPVSGHVPFRTDHAAVPSEHEWSGAQPAVHPILRPVGTPGMTVDSTNVGELAVHADRSHSQPLVDHGPADLVMAFVLPSSGFDVLVNADHLLAWGVTAADVRAAAMANLEAWSKSAPWTAEEDGGRRLLSSDTGEGWDAARILLPDARRHIAQTLGGDAARVLIGLPERHLLVASSLPAGDEEFGSLFGQFVREAAGSADEPVDERVFELVDGELTVFAAG